MSKKMIILSVLAILLTSCAGDPLFLNSKGMAESGISPAYDSTDAVYWEIR